MNLILRYKKLGTDRFVQHELDQEEYTLDELQEWINNSIFYKNPLTLAGAERRLIKFNPEDMENISVLLENDA